MRRRKLSDRLIDRAWTVVCGRLQRTMPEGWPARPAGGAASSVSASMGWTFACQLLAAGEIPSSGFRRLMAVREVVETLAPSDGRHFADWIRAHDASWLDDERFHCLDDWGTPIKAASVLLGTRRSFSPTSLRYLAHSLWLREAGLVRPGGTVVEIGVGFGGLAAANAWVSGSGTCLVDLPAVCEAAGVMMAESGLSPWCRAEDAVPKDYCLISNYAFSELRADVQEAYFEKYIRDAPRGVILSNAAVFAGTIGGRSDEELVDWFRREGLPVIAEQELAILSPADRACKVSLIHWTREDVRL